jgi:hypothetical protein
MSALNGAGLHEEILRRVAALETSRDHHDRQDGKLMTAFRELRDVVVAHSKGNQDSIAAISESVAAMRESVVQLRESVALLRETPKKRSKR